MYGYLAHAPISPSVILVTSGGNVDMTGDVIYSCSVVLSDLH